MSEHTEVSIYGLTHRCADPDCHVPGFVRTLREREAVSILCTTPSGCTCGAPASTPAGMHHCDCAVHPGWCGDPQCLPCVENGKVRQ